MRKIDTATTLLWLILCFSPQLAQATDPTLMVLGDSLSAGYGIELSQSWVHLLAQRLRQNGFAHRVVNISISGDTSRSGLSRLPSALERYRPDIVVLELGGNDGLRGLSLGELRRNLSEMIELCRQAGARVALAEMRIPPNYGPRYTEKFRAIYQELAEQYDLTLIPFLLEGVATKAEFMQQDGVHPRAEAQPLILDNVWPALQSLLEAP